MRSHDTFHLSVNSHRFARAAQMLSSSTILARRHVPVSVQRAMQRLAPTYASVQTNMYILQKACRPSSMSLAGVSGVLHAPHTIDRYLAGSTDWGMCRADPRPLLKRSERVHVAERIAEAGRWNEVRSCRGGADVLMLRH